MNDPVSIKNKEFEIVYHPQNREPVHLVIGSFEKHFTWSEFVNLKTSMDLVFG